MPHRAHLFSLRVAHALRESCLVESYDLKKFSKDILSGVTVGIIAIPLAMALAIASGVAPQYGLYTAIIAGFIIALTGGSRYSVSGPTAAFVVILYPIAQRYGLGGLLVATMLSGVVLMLMALFRLGRLIEYIPESVTLGFTGGIAVVIFTLQIKDIFGLDIKSMPEHYVDKLSVLMTSMPTLQWPSLVVALLTFVVMLLWPRLKTPIPPHLPAILLGAVLAVVFNHLGFSVETIGSRFSYVIDGTVNGVISTATGRGIPPILPSFEWPWLQQGANGLPLQWNWQTIHDLLIATFAIAMLGAIESLLCAVVLDGMSGTRHSANSELFGQGLGNIITPFFGGITATAAIARSAANFKSGAQSPIAAMIHALVVLLGLVVLARWLSYLPMSAMSALLVMVAWNMSELPKISQLIKTAPRSDVWVFMTCFLLTVFFDMVVAITTGVLLAAILFVKDLADMTKVTDISEDKRLVNVDLPEGFCVLKINGPLFFAAAEKIFGEIANLCASKSTLVLYMDGVTVLDAGGLAALNKLRSKCVATDVSLRITDLQFQPLKTLARAGIEPIPNRLMFYPTLKEALQFA